MSVEAKLDEIIKNLEASREDAQKCDKGKAGEPGTRLRAAAQDAKNDLTELRKVVIEARKKG